MRAGVSLAVAFVLGLVIIDGAIAQGPPQPSLNFLVDVHAKVTSLNGREVWPGFRPDTIPVQYVLPDDGALLLGWTGDLPEGFSAVPGVAAAAWRAEPERGAASTATSIGGRVIAQIVVDELTASPLIGLTVHEMFHVFQASVRREGLRFGRGENSFLVTRYPIFDVSNETAFALEGKLLDAIMSASSDSAMRTMAKQYVAIREGRQRRLGAALAEFEALAELNEGLAQYAGMRGLELLARTGPSELRSDRLAAAEEMLGDLNGLTASRERSIRLRYYSTGPAIALILDRMEPESWKSRLIEDDLTLQDALAQASGYRQLEIELRQVARDQFDADELEVVAQQSVASLREMRKAQVDSALSSPGILIEISAEALGGIGMCGLDPQNVHQVDAGVLFHTRWFVACTGSSLRAEFTAPVVHDQQELTLRAVIGSVQDVSLTVGGAPVSLDGESAITAAEEVVIEAPGLTLRAANADVQFNGSLLRIHLFRK